MNRAQVACQFSSATDLWSTPDWLFSELDDEFHFSTDVCALTENAKCPNYYTPETDGLMQEWKGTCWMNPPYGEQIGLWLHKAWDSAASGALVVCLLPSRTDTHWWHDYVMEATEVRFLKGRLKFGNAADSAPFASVVVVFRPFCPLTKANEDAKTY